MTEYEFHGWVSHDKNAIGNMKWEKFTPKTWMETDVDIKITHCGICASDLHTMRSGWGEAKYPQIVGHEIVGTVIRAGKEVKNVKVGDRVGVGAQCGSCLECHQCSKSREQYCDRGIIGTYNGLHEDKSKSTGGYADYTRVPSHFAIKIPADLPSEIAAPMLCGGATVYSPLKDNGAGTTAKDVGIIGIGGLGHFGVMFAAGMGANVTAISHSERKKDDAIKLGAKNFIVTGGSEDWNKKHRRSLDLIVCTANANNLPFAKYLELLRPGCKFVLVGVPEAPLPSISAFQLIMNNISLGGSAIAGTAQIEEMLNLAAKQKLHSWIEARPMTEANKAVEDMEKGDARYRYVLVNEKNLR